MASLPTFTSFNSHATGEKDCGNHDTLKPKTSAGAAEETHPKISELVQGMMPRLRENKAWMRAQMGDRQLMWNEPQAPLAYISNSQFEFDNSQSNTAEPVAEKENISLSPPTQSPQVPKFVPNTNSHCTNGLVAENCKLHSTSAESANGSEPFKTGSHAITGAIKDKDNNTLDSTAPPSTKVSDSSHSVASNSNGSKNAIVHENQEDQQFSTVQSVETSDEELDSITIGGGGDLHPSASPVLNGSLAPAAIVPPPVNDGAPEAAELDPMSDAGLLLVPFRPINFVSFFLMPRLVTGLFLTICLYNHLLWNKDTYNPPTGFAYFNMMMDNFYEPLVFVSRVSIAALFIKALSALSAELGPRMMLTLGPPIAGLLFKKYYIVKEHGNSESMYYVMFWSVVLLVIFSAGDLVLKNVRTKFNNGVLSDRSKLAPTYYFYVMGSGGHTTEMVALIRLTHKANKNAHRRYLWTDGDHHSANQVILLEHALKMQFPNGDAGTADGAQAMRARGVGQSYISSINTSIQSGLHIANALVTFPISRTNDPQAELFRFPDVIVTNGPGTGFIVAVVAFALKVFFVTPRDSMKVVFMETWARGQHLGLTGKLMRATKLANVFVVQSEDMANAYNLPSIGNVNQKWAEYCQKQNAAAAKQAGKAVEQSVGQSAK